MQVQDLITDFGLTVDKADLVLEYLREVGSEGDCDVFNAVMTVNNVCNKHSEITSSPATVTQSETSIPDYLIIIRKHLVINT